MREPDPAGSGHDWNNLNRWKIVEFLWIRASDYTQFYFNVFWAFKIERKGIKWKNQHMYVFFVIRLRQCSAANRNRGRVSNLTGSGLPNAQWSICFLLAAIHWPNWIIKKTCMCLVRFWLHIESKTIGKEQCRLCLRKEIFNVVFVTYILTGSVGL